MMMLLFSNQNKILLVVTAVFLLIFDFNLENRTSLTKWCLEVAQMFTLALTAIAVFFNTSLVKVPILFDWYLMPSQKYLAVILL